jgi:hypothetical protein
MIRNEEVPSHLGRSGLSKALIAGQGRHFPGEGYWSTSGGHRECRRRLSRTRITKSSSVGSPLLCCDGEATVVGGLIKEHTFVPSACFHHAKTLKDADRAVVGIERLSPNLLQAELVEAIVKGSGRRRLPEPPTPAASLSDHESKLTSVRLISMEVDVADQKAFVDHP